MTASTWTWLGGTGFSTIAADWTLTAGAGDNGNLPLPGDVVVVPAGVIEDGLAELAGQGSVTIQAGATISVTAPGDGISLGRVRAAFSSTARAMSARRASTWRGVPVAPAVSP